MAKISDATLTLFKDLQDKVNREVSGVGSFEEAAQLCTEFIYQAFKDSIVLVRLFIIIPYGKLPDFNKIFVDKLSASKGVTELVNDQTPVLSLSGTSGDKIEWNDRKKSEGHVGIPLVSSAFVNAIPMISRLLGQLGLGLNWIDINDTQMVIKQMGSMAGLFYVSDAATEVDQQDRKIIVAQDFVSGNGVKTVLGFGSGYEGMKTFFVTILFLRETLDKTKAEQFATAMSFFRDSTAGLVKREIFL
jgi:hypothetical protein